MPAFRQGTPTLVAAEQISISTRDHQRDRQGDEIPAVHAQKAGHLTGSEERGGCDSLGRLYCGARFAPSARLRRDLSDVDTPTSLLAVIVQEQNASPPRSGSGCDSRSPLLVGTLRFPHFASRNEPPSLASRPGRAHACGDARCACDCALGLGGFFAAIRGGGRPS
jgi:hypothetical protein